MSEPTSPPIRRNRSNSGAIVAVFAAVLTTLFVMLLALLAFFAYLHNDRNGCCGCASNPTCSAVIAEHRGSPVHPVPEPGTWSLILFGTVLICAANHGGKNHE